MHQFHTHITCQPSVSYYFFYTALKNIHIFHIADILWNPSFSTFGTYSFLLSLLLMAIPPNMKLLEKLLAPKEATEGFSWLWNVATTKELRISKTEGVLMHRGVLYCPGAMPLLRTAEAISWLNDPSFRIRSSKAPICPAALHFLYRWLKLMSSVLAHFCNTSASKVPLFPIAWQPSI